MRERALRSFLFACVALTVLAADMQSTANDVVFELLAEVNAARRSAQVLTDEQVEQLWEMAEAGEDFQPFLQKLLPGELERILPYTKDYEDQLSAFSEAEMERLTTKSEGPETISQEQAREDVETAFQIFKIAYGAYEYFGGDAAFGAAREKVLAGLLETGEAVRTEELERLLVKALSFVQDGHVSVGTQGVMTRQLAFMHNSHVFYQGEDGLFYTDIGGEAYTLSGVFSKSMRRTILPDGQIGYRLVLMKEYLGSATYMQVMELRDKQGNTREENWLFECSSVYYPEGPTFEVGRVSGIPVHTLRQMRPGPGETNEQLLAEIERGARAARGSPVMILDIRGNGGGSDTYPIAWYRGLTGFSPVYGMVWGEKVSPLAAVAFPQMLEALSLPVEEAYIRALEEQALTGRWRIYLNPTIWRKNETIIFVLTDAGIGSSGESMINHLRTLENVIFVGTNTRGNSIGGNVMSVYLPHSRIALTFGRNLLLGYGMDNIDGIGFMPDLWVSSRDALSAVIKLCEYYGLK